MSHNCHQEMITRTTLRGVLRSLATPSPNALKVALTQVDACV